MVLDGYFYVFKGLQKALLSPWEVLVQHLLRFGPSLSMESSQKSKPGRSVPSSGLVTESCITLLQSSI